jgi:hypothetical protein
MASNLRNCLDAPPRQEALLYRPIDLVVTIVMAYR